ncbi:DNA/RNA non-specific endonuclease [Salinimonas sediminis]|uniref:Endonuclease n=1 Tax=Salinimonas sediminis TaxID=2303538 RepID=A0A346NMX4_9ALTE|nr:DNA/RNA non-specific endonuclease [Salinimonas sediminis]AXR06881.1 DNA/RNA non-specific endonuclease [Salinimonas sediminis]
MKAMVVCWLSCCSFMAWADNCLHGCPTGVQGTLLTRTIYTLNNNDNTKFANWVAYHVTPTTIDGPSRSRYWKADPLLAPSATLEPDDYDDANAVLGTDRGHQVPLASFSNTADWPELNYLSNITPQDSDLNQGPWVRLENAVRTVVRTGQDVFVVSGPLYESYFGNLPQADEAHTLPSGYFKVIMTFNDGWVDASGFVLYQSASRSDNFCTTEVTIDEIEQRSGLNIMPLLPAYKEPAVEGQLGGLRTKLGC